MWKMQCHLPPPHSCSPPPQALDLILDATPFPFSLELAAAAASRSDLLSLDKWLMDHLARDDGPAFLLALLRFLDAKTQVCGRAYVAGIDSFSCTLPTPSLVPLLLPGPPGWHHSSGEAAPSPGDCARPAARAAAEPGCRGSAPGERGVAVWGGGGST